MDRVRIHDLQLDCIVGLRPQERTRAQRVHVDLALELNLRQAGRTGRIALTADYDRVTEEVIALLTFRRYRLIEVAAEELCAMLLGSHPYLEAVSIRLEKPGALLGRARAASVEVRRVRQDYCLSAVPEGDSDVLLLRTDTAELTLVSIPPGEAMHPAPAEPARSVSWLLKGQLSCPDGRVRVAGLAEDCDARGNATWINREPAPARLFRCLVHGAEAART